jgi:U3 small nucleolar RNA-associated protein 22
VGLEESVQGLKAKIVMDDDDGVSDIQDKACLEIVTLEGWAFSMRIWHDREIILLDRIISGSGNLPHIVVKTNNNHKSKEYYEALRAKTVYSRRFIHGPRHHRVISTLYHLYPAFSGTVRLVKRWLGSHWLLGSWISEEVVEIICASFFVGDGRGRPGGSSIVDMDMDTEERQRQRHLVPGSKERGFSIVVQFLKDWKWEDGLMVPLYGDVLSDNAPNAATPLIPPHNGVWKVSTEHDKEGYVWTSNGPDVLVAHRVRSLADATWNCLQTLERARIDIKVSGFFSTFFFSNYMLKFLG